MTQPPARSRLRSLVSSIGLEVQPYKVVAVTLVGVDGCRVGWVCVFLVPDSTPDICVLPTPRSVLRRFPSPAVVAVDIPIGLTDEGRRSCDVEARLRLRAPRASSVFSPPIRPILDCQSRLDASERQRAIDGRGFGAQGWGILPKIREWDETLRSALDRLSELFEVHPEVCFCALNSEKPMAFSKRSEPGATERRRLLEEAFGRQAVASVLTNPSRRLAKDDDVLDALVALWTARRIARGEARRLPEARETDSVGFPMAIWY